MKWKAMPLRDGRQALLLDYPAKGEELSPDEVNRNLLCVDGEERVHWQVQAPPPFQPSGDPFVLLEMAGETLIATRFFGHVCEVDTINGHATVVGWAK